MIIPLKDIKLTNYKTCSQKQTIYVFSNSNKRNFAINTEIISKRIILTTCADKEYMIGFQFKDPNKLKKFENKGYLVTETSIEDALDYCKCNKLDLLMLNDDDKLWYNLNPITNTTSIHQIDFSNL